jgi:hypothetical protein
MIGFSLVGVNVGPKALTIRGEVRRVGVRWKKIRWWYGYLGRMDHLHRDENGKDKLGFRCKELEGRLLVSVL